MKRALFGATVLALSACPRAEESSAACETEQIEIRVRGTIELPESMAKSSALDEARLLVSVHESSSVRCSGRYVVEQHPGGDIYSAQLDAFGDFEFDVVSTVFPGEKPSLGLDILIDTNANGSCDEGELMHVGGFDADGKAGPVRFEATCYGRL